MSTITQEKSLDRNGVIYQRIIWNNQKSKKPLINILHKILVMNSYHYTKND